MRLDPGIPAEHKSLHAADPGRLTRPAAGSLGKDIVIVLAIALAARFFFMLVMPPMARSTDAFNWETVAKVLAAGGNPYQTTTFLNWPPFWLQIIFVLSKISTALALPFFRVLQVFLILVESLVIVALIRLLREVAPGMPIRWLVVAGLALNPAAILLTCQHCNFDVLVALWVTLFTLSLVRYDRSRDYADWLFACLFLGLGILTKTVPLILLPLLAGGFRSAAKNVRFLGLFLVFGPVFLGMSIIYVLVPADAASKVLAYRGLGGAFGFPGLLRLAGAGSYIALYNSAFYLLLLAVMAGTSALIWRRQSIGPRETVLLTALLLMGIPALGPGYAPQYLYWYLPLLVAVFGLFDGRLRLGLAGFALIAVATYLFEYAILESDGDFFLNYLVAKRVDPHQWQSFIHKVILCQTPAGQTLFRLPLFVAYLAVLGVGVSVLFEKLKRNQNQLAGSEKANTNCSV